MEPNHNSQAMPAPTGKRRKRLLWAIVIVLITLFSVEGFARFQLGLGDPPVSIADPEIEYLFAPNQTCKRFGNLIHYNAYSMRSDDFPAKKSSPDEYRVMVFGDSVVNGGVLTDQRDIATSILQRELAIKLGRPVVVGNISAGSWGPPNMLAYAKRFGFFDADAVVIVLSSHDYADVPTFEPIVGVNPAFPAKKPWLASEEAIVRYLPRYLPWGQAVVESDPMVNAPSDKQIGWGIWAATELARAAEATGARVLFLQHWDQSELTSGAGIGHDLLANAMKGAGAAVIDLGPDEKARGAALYLDNIHLAPAGQQMLKEKILTSLEGIQDR